MLIKKKQILVTLGSEIPLGEQLMCFKNAI